MTMKTREDAAKILLSVGWTLDEVNSVLGGSVQTIVYKPLPVTEPVKAIGHKLTINTPNPESDAVKIWCDTTRKSLGDSYGP